MSRFSIGGVFLSLAVLSIAVGFWYWQTQEKNKMVNNGSPTVLGIQTKTTNGQQSLSADKLYGLINGYRREYKLSPLTAHTALEHSARLKLNDMIAKKYWRHADVNNYPPWQFFTQAGYQYAQAGENLAFGVTSSWQTFSDWKNSPPHNKQLLEKKYQHMGIAIDCDYYKTYAGKTCLVVLHLGTPR